MWDGGGHRYHLEKVVGNGAFGIVWRARSEDGEVVAIKKVMLDRRYHNRELQMMKVMEHENVVRLRHYFEKAGRKKDETFLHLVMDYLPETIRSVALKHHKRARRFNIDHIKAYLWQTFRALEYIHARRICHRDIKPDNLLCDPASLKCRLCDFGCSKVRASSRSFFQRRLCDGLTLVHAGAPAHRRHKRPLPSTDAPRAHPPPPPARLAALPRFSSRANQTCRTYARGTTARPSSCSAPPSTPSPSTCGQWARS